MPHRRRIALGACAGLTVVTAVGQSITQGAIQADAAGASTPLPTLPSAMPFSTLPLRSIPPPSPSTKVPAAQQPATASMGATSDPTEGWTSDSHWTSDGHGHVKREMYLAPMFRHDTAGWHQVDPTLHGRSDPAQPVSAEQALRPIRFGSTASHLAELELDRGPVTISAEGLQIGRPELDTHNTVTYTNVAAATDLRYTVGPGGIDEEEILHDATAPTQFTFFLDDPTGELGTPHALGPNGPFIFDKAVAPDVFLELGAPFAYPQGHQYQDPKSAHLTVQRSGGGYLLTEWIDPTWLQGKSYPIVLDPPTVWVPVSIGGTWSSPQVYDFWIRADYNACGNSCTGSPLNQDEFLNVGTINDTFGGTNNNWIDRDAFHFDLSSIPIGSAVQAGSVALWLENTGCDGQGQGGPCPTTDPTEVHRYNAPFPYSSYISMQTLMNNTDATVQASTVPCNAIGPGKCATSFNIESQVDRWVSGADQNNGIVLRGHTETGNPSGPVWFSSYYPWQSGWAVYPVLDVTYSPPPSAPTNVIASALNDTTASVTWGAASTNGGDAITGYTVTTFTSAGVQVGTTTVCGTCSSASIGGLTAGSSYYFTVKASNDWTTGPTATSNVLQMGAAPTVTKTTDFTGSYMLPGQSTTFHIRLTSPSGTRTVTTIKDVLPGGLAFTDTLLGAVHISSSLAGVPSTCVVPACTINDTTLTLTYSPALTLGPSDYLQIDYPVVAVDSGHGCFSEVNTATASNANSTSVSAPVAIATCEGGLGFENYWQYITRSLGVGAKAAINVSSGNLVVQQDDFTPVQAHGQLALVLRRTYNSGDTAVANLPGTLGSGWQWNVSETDDVVADAAGASALYLPNTSTVVGSPFAATLIDRDGTRHVYQPNGLTAAIDVQSLDTLHNTPIQDISGPLTTLYPLAIRLATLSTTYQPKFPYNHICVDQTYTPPPGVHMSLWRYVADEAGATGSKCNPLAATTAAIAGYGAESADRVRYEFSADGHLLAMADAAGNVLQYTYGTVASNESVTTTPPYPDAGPFSVPVSITEPATGRSFTFAPLGANGAVTGFQVTDPAGRLTTYRLDGQFPAAHLVEVDNFDGSKVTYAYAGTCATAYGAATGAAANQMCSETDPRGNTTFFTYTGTSSDGHAYPQLPRVNAITDRRESAVNVPANRQYTTHLSFYEPTAPTLPWVAVDQAGHDQRFSSIDGFGRVGELDEGATGGGFIHTTLMTWDGQKDAQTGQVTYCRQPDTGRDNLLCHTVRQDPGGPTPDDNTTFVYGDEGQRLGALRCLGSAQAAPTVLPPCATTLDTTSGYQEEYYEATGAVATFSDSDAGYSAATGHAAIVSTNRGGSAPARADGATLFAIIDRVEDVPPRGNAPPASGQTAQQTVNTYQTTYQVDASASAAPSVRPSGTVCSGTQSNTGLRCVEDGPAFDTTGAAAVRQYTYGSDGERLTYVTPLGGTYQYVYYPDPPGSTDVTQTHDFSGHTPSGGWLKAVIAPTLPDGSASFVAYGYDASGNRVRTWDRDATQYTPTQNYPGTVAGGAGASGTAPPCTFAEVRYSAGTNYGTCPGSVTAAAYATPGRFVLFKRDQPGDTTTYQVDADGNVVIARPPRGNPSSTSSTTSYDVSQAFDANDNLTCHIQPYEAVHTAGTNCSGSPALGASIYSYDAFNNRIVTLDPRDHYAVDSFDSVNRLVQHWFSRGAMPSSSSLVPAGCHQAGQAGDPAQFGTGTFAPMICSTRSSYDYVDNLISAADANAQTTTYHYDSVHRKVQQLVPRSSGVTETTDSLYDADGHITDVCPPNEFTVGSGTCTSSSVYSWHDTFDSSGRVSTHTTFRSAGNADTTSYVYDADGNRVQRTDPRGGVWTASYDALDRELSETAPRSTGVGETTYFQHAPSGELTMVVQPGSFVAGGGTTPLVIDGQNAANSTDGVAHPQGNAYQLTTANAQYSSVTLQNGGWMIAPPYGSGAAGGQISMTVAGTLTICATCGLTVAGLGPHGGAGGVVTAGAKPGTGTGLGGPGGAGATSGAGGGGAGHYFPGVKGSGVVLAGAAGAEYDSFPNDASTPSTLFGSGGGGGGIGGSEPGGSGGAGGGYIRITADTITVNGTMDSSGVNGLDGTKKLTEFGGGGGGGSGGTIWLTAERVDRGQPGNVQSGGGSGGVGGNAGGGGSNGPIRIDADESNINGERYYPGRVTTYKYDAAHRRTDTVVGADGQDARNTVPTSGGGSDIHDATYYDADGNVIGLLNPRAWLAPGGSSSFPNPLFITRIVYDEDGRRTATYSPRYDNSTPAYADPGISGTQAAQCTTTQRPPSVSGVPDYLFETGVCVTQYRYDESGNLSSVVFPTSSGNDNRFLSYGYTDDNLLSTSEAPSASSSVSSSNGCPRADVVHSGTYAAACYAYDGDGRPIQSTDALSHVTSTTYFSDGLLQQVTHQPGTSTHQWQYSYDGNGNTTAVTDGAQKTTASSYYADNLVQSITDAANDVTSYVYDPVGNRTEVWSPSANACDPNNCTSSGKGTPTTYCFTGDNLVAIEWQPVTSDGVQQRQTVYTYDRGGRKIAQQQQLVNGSNAAGCTPITTSGASSQQIFAYYLDDRLAHEAGRDGIGHDYGYDAAGELTGVDNTFSADYYADGLLRDGTGGTLSYDGLGVIAGRADSQGQTTTYQMNDAELMSSMTSGIVQGGTTTLTYDVGGRPSSETDPNGVTSQWQFNADDTLASLAEGPTGSLAHWTYTYDADYRQTSQGFSGTPAAGGGSVVAATFCFGYDAAGRLNVAVEASPCPTSPTPTISRDHDGNATATKDLATGQQTAYAYHADDSIASNTTLGLTSTYTEWGGVLADGCFSYTYDGLDRLSTVAPAPSAPSGCGWTSSTAPQPVSYTYDGLGRQTTRTDTAGTTSLTYDGFSSSVSSESRAGSTAVDYELDVMGTHKALSQQTAATTEYLGSDGHGNVVIGATSSGSTGCTVRLDPFGTPVAPLSRANPCSSGTTNDSSFYRDSRRDPSTGFYQFGNRTYRPSGQDFLTPDVYRGGSASENATLQSDPLTEDTYGYVNGDPVNLVDPDGHNACSQESCDPGQNRALAASDRGASNGGGYQRTYSSPDTPSRLSRVEVINTTASGDPFDELDAFQIPDAEGNVGTGFFSPDNIATMSGSDVEQALRAQLNAANQELATRDTRLRTTFGAIEVQDPVTGERRVFLMSSNPNGVPAWARKYFPGATVVNEFAGRSATGSGNIHVEDQMISLLDKYRGEGRPLYVGAVDLSKAPCPKCAPRLRDEFASDFPGDKRGGARGFANSNFISQTGEEARFEESTGVSRGLIGLHQGYDMNGHLAPMSPNAGFPGYDPASDPYLDPVMTSYLAIQGYYGGFNVR